MEVSRSEWVSKAIDNVDRYLNRGGDLKGDEPQLLGGANLLNTIGVAMGLNVEDPIYWTKQETKQALKGELVFFVGNARKVIDVIAKQIRNCCGGDDKNFVTVLPIELYKDGKLCEVPLFRVKRYKSSKEYYVDDGGRYYDSVSDWYSFNKLPACEMAYPYDLRLVRKPGHRYSRVLVADTPSARVGEQIVDGVDMVATIAGLTSAAGLMVATGGLATPLAIAGTSSALWGTGRCTYQLADRALHGESLNPFTNSESRTLWLSIGANFTSLGAKGAAMRLARRSNNVSGSSRVFINVMKGSNITIRGVKVVDGSLNALQRPETVSSKDALMLVASIAFLTKDVYKFEFV